MASKRDSFLLSAKRGKIGAAIYQTAVVCLSYDHLTRSTDSVIWQILFSQGGRWRWRTPVSTTVRELISHGESVPAETSISSNMVRDPG